MKYEKPDGVIETGFSGCCCPPGVKRGGQHTNSGTSWWKTDDGEWQACHRSSKISRAAIESKTVEEFKERIKAEV